MTGRQRWSVFLILPIPNYGIIDNGDPTMLIQSIMYPDFTAMDLIGVQQTLSKLPGLGSNVLWQMLVP